MGRRSLPAKNQPGRIGCDLARVCELRGLAVDGLRPHGWARDETPRVVERGVFWAEKRCLVRSSFFVVTGADFFFDFGGFADAVAEVVQFGATDAAFAGDFDFGDFWAVDWEDALDAFAVDQATHGEGGVDVAVAFAFADDGAAEELDTLFVAFFNAVVHGHRVTNVEWGGVLGAAILLRFRPVMGS